MAKWLYPFETNASTIDHRIPLGKRNRQVFVGEDVVQKVVQRFKIELKESLPGDPDLEFNLQVVRDVLTCAPTLCGSATVYHKPSTGRISKRSFSLWVENKINTTDGTPELYCKLEKDSICFEYQDKSSEQAHERIHGPSRLYFGEESPSSSEDEDESGSDTDDSEDEGEPEDMDEKEDTDSVAEQQNMVMKTRTKKTLRTMGPGCRKWKVSCCTLGKSERGTNDHQFQCLHKENLS